MTKVVTLVLEALPVCSPQATGTGRSYCPLRGNGERFPPPSLIGLDADEFAFSTERSSDELPLTNETLLAAVAAAVDGPVMLAVAAVFPKAFSGKIAGEIVRTTRALDSCIGSYIKVDLVRRAIDPNRAWGE